MDRAVRIELFHGSSTLSNFLMSTLVFADTGKVAINFRMAQNKLTPGCSFEFVIYIYIIQRRFETSRNNNTSNASEIFINHDCYR